MTKHAKSVRILVTGGTIDKVHDTRTEALAFSSDDATHVPEMLQVGRCHFPAVQVVMLKDSLHMDADDRVEIATAISSAEEDGIVITHGTSTMGETARILDKTVSGKTVILTGAMRPFSLYSSDGEFNLGGAVIAAQVLPSGVWGVMNGRVLPSDQLEKNIEKGRFDV